MTGSERARATFTDVQPLDVLSALNPANRLDVIGTFTMAMEADFVCYDDAAERSQMYSKVHPTPRSHRGRSDPARTFTQSFSGADGRHTHGFSSDPA